MNHKEKLDQFLNSLITKGVSVAEVDAARAFYTAHPELIQATAEGVLSQDELSRRLAEVSTLSNSLQTRQTEWNTYIQKANQTLTEAEQARLLEATARGKAETAIKALAQQYNIPEDEVRAIYTEQPIASVAKPPVNMQNPQGDRMANVNQNQNVNSVTREDLVGLINDIGKKDSINARHFALTGRPWDSSKAINYISEQATLGKQVDIEAAWRVTENIDSIEAAKATADNTAAEAAMEAKIRAKIASETPNPLDATPQFAETKLASIFQTSQDNADPNAVKEQTGHHGRTRAAVAALHVLQNSRRLGQKSPYDLSTASA